MNRKEALPVFSALALFIATSVGAQPHLQEPLSGSAPAYEKSSLLSFNLRMSECENRWVVLPKTPGDDSSLYGYIYIDRTAGFTFHAGGRLRIDAEGNYRGTPNAVSIKTRLGRNGVVAALPKDALTQPGLDEKPEWAKFYEDTSDTVTHRVRWGRAYNHIGDPGRALAYLESGYKEQPHATGLGFELAYAYNALRRFDEAIAVLTSAVERDRKNPDLCRELAFSYLHTKKSKEATEQYLYCISISPDGNLVIKSEMAFNLARAYQQLGDRENCRQWMSKAKEWAPQGSRLHRYLNQQPESAGTCAS